MKNTIKISIFFFLTLTLLQSCKEKGSALALHCYKNARKMGLHKFPLTAQDTKVHQTFKPYIASFERYYGGGIGEIGVDFGKTDTFATCRISFKGSKNIIINKAKWQSVERLQGGNGMLEVLMFHELGHCVLERLGHNNHRINLNTHNSLNHPIKVSMPATIMAEELSISDLSLISRHKALYLKELFTKEPIKNSSL